MSGRGHRKHTEPLRIPACSNDRGNFNYSAARTKIDDMKRILVAHLCRRFQPFDQLISIHPTSLRSVRKQCTANSVQRTEIIPFTLHCSLSAAHFFHCSPFAIYLHDFIKPCIIFVISLPSMRSWWYKFSSIMFCLLKMLNTEIHSLVESDEIE